MRRLLIVLGLIALLAAPGPGDRGEAQAQRSLFRAAVGAAMDTLIVEHIESSFRAGNPAVLLAHAAEPLDVAIYGHGASYSRSQAALVLMDFFRRHPPAAVTFREEVASENRRSIVGHYQEAGSAEPSAVFVRLRARDGRWEIRSIRIERAGRRH
jgi:hypothetical protein